MRSNRALYVPTQSESDAWALKCRQRLAEKEGADAWTFAKGKNNPYEEGTLEHDYWVAGYKRMEEYMGDHRRINQSHNFNKSSDVARVITLTPKKRGRPAKPKVEKPVVELLPGQKRLGRPPGSKNKPK